MKRIWNRCHRRKEVSLLASGALGEAEQAELQSHLATCPECQSYHNELKSLTARLADWEKNLSAVEVAPAARMRWARAVQTADHPSQLTNIWRFVWLELIRPSRYAWAGMVAAWMLLLAANGHLSDHQAQTAEARNTSTSDMAQAWVEQNRVLAELTQPTFAAPATPSVVPRPHSEWKLAWKIT
jgi:anti-sigma factor RsiW